MKLSRRDLIRVGLAAATQWARGSAAAMFEEVSPTVSGITWVHENAMSERRHLPETLGPGAPFLTMTTMGGWISSS